MAEPVEEAPEPAAADETLDDETATIDEPVEEPELPAAPDEAATPTAQTPDYDEPLFGAPDEGEPAAPLYPDAEAPSVPEGAQEHQGWPSSAAPQPAVAAGAQPSSGFGPSARPDKEQQMEDELSEGNDLLTLAMLSPWMEENIDRIGRDRLVEVIEIYSSMGGRAGRPKQRTHECAESDLGNRSLLSQGGSGLSRKREDTMGFETTLYNGHDLPANAEQRERLLAQAMLLSSRAKVDLSQSKAAREAAERARAQAEVDAVNDLEETLAELRAEAQALKDETKAVRAAAEADRQLARQELEQASQVRKETERVCSQMDLEGRQRTEAMIAAAEEKAQRTEADTEARAEETIDNARNEAEANAAEVRRRTAEEVQHVMEDITTARNAAFEELEAQRLLTEAARIRAEAAGRQKRTTARTQDRQPEVKVETTPPPARKARRSRSRRSAGMKRAAA